MTEPTEKDRDLARDILNNCADWAETESFGRPYIRVDVDKAAQLIASSHVAREQKWIPVSEILPVRGFGVAIRLRDGSELQGALLQSDGDWWWKHRFLDPAEVTDWRNAPPQQQKEKL